MPPVPLSQLRDQAAFMAAVGPLYEESPWIAERAFARHHHGEGQGTPFESITAIDQALWAVVCEATSDEQLGLLRAHPDLAGKAALAGELTAGSTEEQRCAGLGSLTVEEMTKFMEMNSAYKAIFGFPFILAVRNANKHIILSAFERRVKNAPGVEHANCLAQVRKIAWMRLCLAVQAAPIGGLKCHVTDSASGRPAAGMRVTLRYLNGSGSQEGAAPSVVGEFVADVNGQLGTPALEGASLAVGVYELMFAVGEYFAIEGVPTAGTPFLGQAPFQFGIDNPEAQYEVRLLCSPTTFSCSGTRI